MIGVIPKTNQTAVAEEFFELFKTPWETYRQGRSYEVVLVTGDEVPAVDAKLVLIYGSSPKESDVPAGIAIRGHRQEAILDGRGTEVPVYCGLSVFEAQGQAVLHTNDPASEIAGVRYDGPGHSVIRLGYDLFDEVRFILSSGQPPEHADVPTVDIHIAMLRMWILEGGISVWEIPPTPAGSSFITCLTHDIDFVGIRRHLFDHSMWGFLQRATVGALVNFLRGRLPLARLWRSWYAAASLPFVYAGLVKDFWEPFEWYLKAESGLPATYFLIPFKRRAGEKVAGRHASRRATAYDVSDLPEWTATLLQRGCEVAVHGIDAWHSADKGIEEREAVAAVARKPVDGIRMHWLLRDMSTHSVLEQAGYAYDSTFGYNDTIGYRAGTGQVFRPLDADKLLELPLHIQDGALFYPQKLNLSEIAARGRCEVLIANARKFGGVLTLLWHDRSHGPERFWGDFYAELLQTLRSLDGWFGTAFQVTDWFRKRRRVRFEAFDFAHGGVGQFCYDGEEVYPPLKIRVHRPLVSGDRSIAPFFDIAWNGTDLDEFEMRKASQFLATPLDAAGICSQS